MTCNFVAMQAKMYLNSELIQDVSKQANDIVWKMGILAKFTKKWYDVMTVSPLGLIHIEGNADTGWKHIMERHGYFSNSSYFGDGAVGNPSKFTHNSIPIKDYRDVADEIFHMGQKDTKPHPDGSLFEKYKGRSARHTGAKGIPIEFQLVLYKGTKIVHSLYPTKTIGEKVPKKMLKNFVRDKPKINATTRPCDEFHLINIPYINREGVTRYTIIFKLDNKSLMAKGYIQTHALNGCPIFINWPHICYFKVNTVLPPLLGDVNIEWIRFINGLSLADLSKLEVQIERQEIEIQKVIDRENDNQNSLI
jgi:hypothetical protein